MPDMQIMASFKALIFIIVGYLVALTAHAATNLTQEDIEKVIERNKRFERLVNYDYVSKVSGLKKGMTKQDVLHFISNQSLDYTIMNDDLFKIKSPLEIKGSLPILYVSFEKDKVSNVSGSHSISCWP